MSYKDLQTTVIYLEYGQNPNEFWKYILLIVSLLSAYFIYSHYA